MAITAAAVALLWLCGCDSANDGFRRLRGDSFQADGKHAEAIAWYQRVPTNRQSEALLRGLAMSYDEVDDYTNLTATYRHIYEKSGDVAILEELVTVHLDAGATNAAIETAMELAKADPTNWENKHWLVALMMDSAKSNDVTEAIRSVLDAQAATPEDMVRMAELWLRANEHGSATGLLARALATDSTNTEWRLALASSQARLQDYAGALSNLDLARLAEPDNPRVYETQGDVMIATGKRDEAIACYRTVLHAEQDNAMAMNNLAYLLLDRPDTVREGYELALSAVQMERRASTLDTLAVACYRRGAHDTALRYLREAAVLLREDGAAMDPEIEFHFGLVFGGRSEYHRALPHLRRALDAKPELLDSLANEPWYAKVRAQLDVEVAPTGKQP